MKGYLLTRALCVLSLLMITTLMGAVTHEVGSIRGFLYGSEPTLGYDNWVSHVAEGRASNLNVYAPWETQNNSFGDFVIPSEEQLGQWSQVIACWLALDLPGAEYHIEQAGFPYEVVVFQDTESGRHFYMLRETLNDQIDTNNSEDPLMYEYGSFDYGWGLYIFNPMASRPIMITAPHPCDDYPSPVIGIDAMLMWDAQFLMIAGAGREVAYTGNYTSNNASISDPSRYEAHPFNVAYQAAADLIRVQTGKFEFSVQMHTYDWNKYPGKPPVMLSQGASRGYINLPIRDASRSENDLLRKTPYVVIPAGNMENSDDITIDQYYNVYNQTGSTLVINHTGHQVSISNNNDLPGADLNRQMLYTTQDNPYDVYGPFFHIEMDELPRSYSQTSAALRRFYGFEEETQTWNFAQRYTKFLAYYRPWLTAMHNILDSLLMLDDGIAPSNPENFRASDMQGFVVTLSWTRSYSYDFDSYELHYRYWENNTGWKYAVLDRLTHPSLGWCFTQSYSLEIPEAAQIIYFTLAARDKHGNRSAYSEEIKVWRPATSNNFFQGATAVPYRDRVQVQFVGNVTGAAGYNIYRASAGHDFTLISSWHSNPDLVHVGVASLSFTDWNVQQNQIYRYRLSAEFASGYEYYDWRIMYAQPYTNYALILKNGTTAAQDSMTIGVNILASDTQDALDVTYYTPYNPAHKVLSYTGSGTIYTYYTKDIKAPYPGSSTAKVWKIRAYGVSTNPGMEISIGREWLQSGAVVNLYDTQAGAWHDLTNSPYTYTNTSTSGRHLELWWGHIPPRVIIPPEDSRIVALGANVQLQWTVVNPRAVSSVNILLCGSSEEIVMAEGLSPQIKTLGFAAQSHWPVDSRFAIEMVFPDGSRTREYCGWYVSVVPRNFIYHPAPGFSTMSIPGTTYNNTITDLLDNHALAWTMDSNGFWVSSAAIIAGQGYLLHHPQAFQLQIPSTHYSETHNMILHPGWNLLPNPHFRSYRTRELQFVVGGSTRSWDWMRQNGYVSARAYIYTGSGWEDRDQIDPLQAFLLYSHLPYAVMLSLNPSAALGAIPPGQHLDIRLIATDGYNAGDAVRMGISDDCTDAVDMSHDLPKPPAFPLSNVRLTLTDIDPLGNASGAQTDFRGLYPDYDQVEKHWTFSINAPQATPVGIYALINGLPDDYSVSIQLPGVNALMQPNVVYWFEPAAPGIYTGSITVRNYHPRWESAKTDVSAPAVNPNPSSGQVRLQCKTLPGDHVNLELYNLRGQKVITLHDAVVQGSKLDLVWDGRDASYRAVATGIYILRQQDSRGISTRKLIRVK